MLPITCINTAFSIHFTCIGAVIQSTLTDDQSKTHASALSDLTTKASHVVGLLNQTGSDDGDDDLTFLRLRSKQREVMVNE